MFFPKGETPQEFKNKLYIFCSDEYLGNIACGCHVCVFCGDTPCERWYEEGGSRFGEKMHWLNIRDGEIRVIGKSVIYAAPTFIYQYVVEHQYKPPAEFIRSSSYRPSRRVRRT
jgi:hypothetical protein